MNRRVLMYSVLASILATICVSWFLEPLSVWLWELTSSNALSWFEELQDKAFANASLGTRPWVSALIFIWGAAAALGLLTGVCTSIFFSKGIRL